MTVRRRPGRRLKGIGTMNASVPVRAAATVMMIREAERLEVLMVRRHHQVDFVSGAMVFPGGKIEESDADPAWAEHAVGWDSVPEAERGPRVAAIREAFEESGVVIGAGGAASPPHALEIRKAVDAGEVLFLDYIRQQGMTIDIGALTLFSRWRTPPVVPKRFDTFFYMAPVPAGQTALSDGRETVEAEWIVPDEALRLAAAGQRRIVFPTRMNLKLLASTPTLTDAVAAASRRQHLTVEPNIVTRGDMRYVSIDASHGYGAVEEPLEV